MAHFYADIQGSRGEATRCGTQGSGISGHIRGWSVGAKVEVSFEDGVDVVRVYRTDGSGGYLRKLIAEFTAVDPVVPAVRADDLSARTRFLDLGESAVA